MPWAASDASKHLKGIGGAAAEKWAKTANGVLASCEKSGGKNCEATAIALANRAAKRSAQAEALVTELNHLTSLEEAGRVFAKRNVERLQQALALLGAALSEQEERDAAKATDKLEQAVKGATKAVAEAWADPEEDELGADPVGDGDGGQLVLDEAFAPGSEVVMLEEKAVHPDGTVRVKIASPGWGTKGYYSADVLKRDGRKAWPKGTHMYWNHPTEQEEAARPERDLRDLAAVAVSDPEYLENGPKGEGLYTQAKVFGHYQEAVDQMAPHIGVSLRAAGTVQWGEADGKEGPLVESILQGKSIDFVTKAGRGGEVVSLFESARGGGFKKGVYAGVPNAAPAGGQEDRMSQQELEEAQRRAAAAETKGSRLEEALAVRDARDAARDILSRAALPDVTKERIVAELSQRAPLAEADGVRTLDRAAFTALVEARAKEEAAYIASLTGQTGQVRGLAESDPFGPAPQVEPLDEAKVTDELAGLFRSIGLDEGAAKAAATGRGW